MRDAKARCFVCGSDVEPVISFGKMPIANGFLKAEEFGGEFFFNLQVGFCSGCSLVQLTERVEPEKLFHENYAYFASTSVRMVEHFREFAGEVQRYFPDSADPFVVEIGSNDGIMLKNFAQAGVRHLGVEPSKNVAQEAMRQGVNTKCSFFDRETAAEILREYGPADAILGANVVCHIPDINGLLSAVKLLLKKNGVFIFEDPYLGDIVESTAYDQFYDEHVFYFCFSSLSKVLARHDMVIVDAMPQKVHGGSMRYVIARTGEKPVSADVAKLKDREQYLGLDQVSTFSSLNDRIDSSREELTTLLRRLKKQGRRVVGYGATSKSTTVTNYCGIGPDLVEFISDTTPTKQGKFSPGTHIPVKPYEAFTSQYPDYALLFAWNHGEEIMAKEGRFKDRGGKFITYVPQVQVLE